MKLSQRAILLLILALGFGHANADQTIYFLVAERASVPQHARYNDSYVLPLSKQADIDYARYLIVRNKQGFKEGDRPLVVATPVGGKDGINRNYIDARLPEWSWHIGEFHGFSQGTTGTPPYHPRDLEGYRWTGTNKQFISFLFYTVVKELGPYPLYASLVPGEQSVEVYWSGLGTNYLSTLERKDSLASANWAPVPGGGWPLKTNHWTLPRTNSATVFYRVRAEQPIQ